MTDADSFNLQDELRPSWLETPEWAYRSVRRARRVKGGYSLPRPFVWQSSRQKVYEFCLTSFFGVVFVLLPFRQFEWPGSLVVMFLCWAGALALFYYALGRLRELQSPEALNDPSFLTEKAGFVRGDAVQGVFDCAYRSKKPLPREGKVFARLLVLEVTRTMVGTDTTYEAAELYSSEPQEQTLTPGSPSYRAALSLPLPAGLPPSHAPALRWEGGKQVSQQVVWQVQVAVYSGTRLVSQAAFVLDVE